MVRIDSITMAEVSIKASSKYGVYRVIKNEEGIYLLPQNKPNHKFFSDIITGHTKEGIYKIIYDV